MSGSPERRKTLNIFGPLCTVPLVAMNARGFVPGET